MSKREETLQLISQRDFLDKEIASINEQLAIHNATTETSLLTPDGFPRNDIDVATIRRLRVDLIRKQNDMNDLLERIRINLRYAFPEKADQCSTRNGVDATSTTSMESTPSSTETEQHNESVRSSTQPIGRINSVLSGSLAAEAGLEAGDLIVKFGEATQLNDFATVFRSNAGNALEISVIRNSELLNYNIQLDPQRTLGCHIVSA